MSGYHGFGRAAGAYRIASEWRSRGMEVKVVDCFNSFTLNEIKQIIAKYKTKQTEFIGFSTTFLNQNSSKSTRANTSKNKEQLTETAMTVMEQNELFSYIKSLKLRILIGGFPNGTNLKDSSIEYYTGPCEDKFFPEFDFTKSQIYYDTSDHILEGEDLPIEIARGCIFKCKFCFYHLNGKKLWEFVKSPETIKNEMLRNYYDYGTTGYMFSDDTYNDSQEKVESLMKMYKTLPFDLRFSTYARLDLMISKPETQEMLIESGLKSVFFGIETFNHHAGKIIGKGMDPDKVKRGLLDFREKYPDVLVAVGMIGGLPNETLDDLDESHRFLTEEAMVHSTSWSPLFINSGSEMSLSSNKYGYEKNPDDNRYWTRSDGLKYLDVADWIAHKRKIRRGHPGGFTFYNRIHNMGYRHEDILKLTWANNEQEIFEKTHMHRTRYMQKVLN